MDDLTLYRKWSGWVVALVFALAGAVVVFWQNSRLAVLWDLSYILENSYRISLGDVPYSEFPFPYAPLTFLTQAALMKLTGRVFFHHIIYCAAASGLSTLLTWRILLKALRRVPCARLLALVLTAPLIPLGIYAIFPHPFYDPDCTFAILAGLLLVMRWDEKPGSVAGFMTGAVLVVPVFVKQNTGLAFVVSVVASLVVAFAIDVWRRRASRKYLFVLAGLTIGFVCALALVHFTAGLGNYIRWTVKFAAERRTPAFGEMISVYRDPLLKWWLIVIVFGALVLLSRRGGQWLAALTAAVMAVPFVWSVIYLLLDLDSSERAERLVGLWPLLLIISLVVTLANIRRLSGMDLVLPLVVIGTVHGAFLSQQLWGSTYALWPLFVILVAFVIARLNELLTTHCAEVQDIGPAQYSRSWSVIFAFLVSLSLLISGSFYLRSHERLDYANLDDGELTHSRFPVLKGLTTRGSWITDFDELVDYSEKAIPREDAILCLPGEDLFYYTTGRRPHFPVLMFDHTINPYSPQEIVDLVRVRNVQWLIVKDELQLEEEPVEKKDELLALLMQEFEPVESLDNYEIYKRKSADSDDGRDSGDDDDEAGPGKPLIVP
jgi:hypothetical protein